MISIDRELMPLYTHYKELFGNRKNLRKYLAAKNYTELKYHLTEMVRRGLLVTDYVVERT